MILSHKFRFVFIKGRKVGGTSVEMVLSTICGPDDIVTPITPIDELARLGMGGQAQNYSESAKAEADYLASLQRTPLVELANIRLPPSRYYNHMAFRDLAALSGESLSEYDVICVERSPYSKILSWANAKVSFKRYSAGGKMETDLQSLRRSVDQVMESGEFAITKNIDLYRNADGRVVARAMRYDRLLDDVGAFMNKLGLDKFEALPHAKRGSMSDQLDPRDFFSKPQLNRINDVFAEEFRIFGYVPL